MLCEQCQKNPASVHMTSVMNGQRQEKHLCAQCAAQHEMGSAGLSLQELLSGFFSSAESVAPTQTTVCSRCGMSYQQFRSVGRLGCAQCYTTFERQLQPMLRRIHGTMQHTGKAPQHYDTHRKVQKEMENLRALMQDAIVAEDFEKAAELRDRMKAMEATARGGDRHE